MHLDVARTQDARREWDDDERTCDAKRGWIGSEECKPDEKEQGAGERVENWRNEARGGASLDRLGERCEPSEHESDDALVSLSCRCVSE